MRLEPTSIPDVQLLYLDPHEDERGLFIETYDRTALSRLGLTQDFEMDALSRSASRYTIRGLHFQRPPHDRAKLIRVTTGSVLDVAVDLRTASESFGQHVALELTATSWVAVFVPAGFAHGICTLEPNTEIAYKMAKSYAPDHYSGVLWNDPELAIDWPVSEVDAIVSEHDQSLPRLRDLPPIWTEGSAGMQ
jgi:dTDP-4-dehydrorhamnose 3,5-epimerase